MKKIPWIFLIICFLSQGVYANEEKNQRFSFSPKKPVAGDEIKIQYCPTGTELEDASEISAIVYMYGRGMQVSIGPVPREFSMEKGGEIWTTSFRAEKNIRGIMMKFRDNGNVDNNDRKGFIIPIYTKDDRLVPGHLAGLGEAYSQWGRSLNLRTNFELAYSYFEKEFKLHPELKREYLFSYITAINIAKRDKGRKIVLNELDKLGSKEDLSMQEIQILVSWYDRFNMPEKEKKYKEILYEKYPQFKESNIQSNRWREVIMTRDPTKQIEALKKFKKDFPDYRMMTTVDHTLCIAYLKLDDYAKFNEQLKIYLKGNRIFYMDLLSLARRLMYSEENLDTAEALASRGIELYQKQKANREMRTPPGYLEREWKEVGEKVYGGHLDIYGQILLKRGKKEKALEVFEKAFSLSKRKDLRINEHYAQALVKMEDFKKAVSVLKPIIQEEKVRVEARELYAEALAKSQDSNEALEELEKIIMSGESTSKIREIYREIYRKGQGSEEGLAEKLESLEKAASEKLYAELMDKLIDLPAPDFSLEDLDGNKVSLGELKGKVLILDFWATWCGPCIRSFSGMKVAVEKFKEDKDVKFLFINSWEKVEDKKKNASDFMAKNDYPFQVLLDTESKVIESYKVRGIPTKLIIDKNRKIRFKSIGFEANIDKMVKELKLMIEIIRK